MYSAYINRAYGEKVCTPGDRPYAWERGLTVAPMPAPPAAAPDAPPGTDKA